ncbi:MAG TPA: hypothetical protein VK610_09765 [Rhodothermales bacterium]|nr:hypothetical protein [Rhodothermales bacterium]
MNPWLLAFLAALAIVALAAYALRRGARASRASGSSGPPRDSELGQLGLSEVRPRTSTPERTAEPAPASRATPSTPRPGPPRMGGEGRTSEGRTGESRVGEGRSGPKAGGKGAGRPRAGGRAEGTPSEGPKEETPRAPRPAGRTAPRAATPLPPMDDTGDDALDALFGAVSMPETPSSAAVRGGGDDILGGVRPRAAREGEHAGAPGVTDLLDALRAALSARGVALLRYDAAADTYTLVGRTGAGFGGAPSFPASGNALHRVPADRSISLLETDAFGALRYHLRPEGTVGHAAAIAVGADARHLLVADRGADETPFASTQLDLLGDFSDLLSRLLGGAPRSATPGAPAEADDDLDAVMAARTRPEGSDADPLADALDADAPEADTPDEDAAVPEPPTRRAIIEQEMDDARADGRPLALALVIPRGADALDDEGEGLAADEGALLDRLRAVEGSDRVERFGDLMFGVFGAFTAAEAEDWADRLEADGPPLHIGIALLDERHQDPDDLRADAAAALQEAYEKGTACVILE